MMPVEEGIGLRHRRSPSRPPEILHVHEQAGRTAAGGELTLALLCDLAGLFTVLAAHREGQRSEPLLGDLLAALVAVAVAALLEAHERIVDLVQRLRLHLNERELEVFLDVSLGALDGVEHVVELAAPGAFLADAAHLALNLGLNLPAPILEHALQFRIT